MRMHMKKILLAFLPILFHNLQGQSGKSVFLKLGNNITHYEYIEQSPILRSEPGGSYEIGYKSMVPESAYPGLYYTVGLMVNNFNQVGGSDTSLYRWKTTYMGLQGTLGMRIYKNREGNFTSNVTLGTSLNTFLKGTQSTNNSLYDLKNSSEFKRIFIQSSIGIEGIYNLNNEVFISVGYNLSKTFNFKSNSDENLNFVNNNFFIGTYIDL